MILASATVGPFKSINQPQRVEIDPRVTVLVGMNEAGKTVFLQALEKSRDAFGIAKFEPVEDYPRKDLPRYLKQHGTKPERVTALEYRLTPEEVAEANITFGLQLPENFSFVDTWDYGNSGPVLLSPDERPAIRALVEKSALSSDASAALDKVVTLRGIPDALKQVSLSDQDKAFLASVQARISAAKWQAVVGEELWKWIEPRVPRFLYFGDYDFLPSKTNLADLESRANQAKSDPANAAKYLTPAHRGVLALLRMADVSVADFKDPGGYETLRAKLEGVSINLTDQIMKFWKQNEDLEVVIDIKPDPADTPPYNAGPNLYLRIANRKHRGVTTPFGQRSRGFIWFFSFLVWFDDVQHELTLEGRDARALVLLLDEPGLSLHALAQKDLLRYIDELSERHQVIYSTHSPFLVHMDRMQQIRLVEDRPEVGTVISDTVVDANERTVFPLQAALGWNIAQSLFISERNLLVEGPSDLLYLKTASAMLEASKRDGLRDDVTIVPTGGLDKVVTFVALLGASGLKLAVLHDYRGTPEQKLIDLVRQKMISARAVMNAATYRTVPPVPSATQPTDIEDLLPVDVYLSYFNAAYKAQLKAPIAMSDLPPGERVTDRIERYLSQKRIKVRPSGGFNHYVVALEFAAHPPTLDSETLARFEALFRDVNALLSN